MRIKILFSMMLVIFFSCDEDDFLNRPPIAQTVEADFPRTAGDALLAVNGIYNTLRIWNFHEGGFPVLSFVSDDLTKGSNPSDGIAIAPYDNFTYTADEGSMERWWSTLYQGIRRANLVINNLPEISLDEDIKNQYLAEARFLRGYFYSILIRAFGDVPKVLDINPSIDISRSPLQEILDEIIVPDLEFSADHLKYRSDYDASDRGRATRDASRALLARVYLYFGNFEKVEELTLEIIAGGQYELEPNYADAFSVAFEYGTESIFEIGALPVDFTEGGNQYANTLGIRGTPNRGWGFGRPAYSLLLDFDVDPRLDASVIFLGEVLDGVVTTGDGATPDTTYNPGNPSEIIEIECYNQKIWTPGTDTRATFGHNKRIIRYADVLLMAAEALNENDNPAQALIYLNEVRARARGGDVTALPDITTTDKLELQEAIYNERRFELAMEGLRFWDLVRTDRAEQVLGPLGFVKGTHELFPIPQSEIDITEGRIDQNSGYN